jgi:hypothetical protein
MNLLGPRLIGIVNPSFALVDFSNRLILGVNPVMDSLQDKSLYLPYPISQLWLV